LGLTQFRVLLPGRRQGQGPELDQGFNAVILTGQPVEQEFVQRRQAHVAGAQAEEALGGGL